MRRGCREGWEGGHGESGGQQYKNSIAEAFCQLNKSAGTDELNWVSQHDATQNTPPLANPL